MKISLTPSSFTRHLSSIIFRYHNHIFVYDCDSFYSDSGVRVLILGGCRPNLDQSGMFYLFLGLNASHIAWNVGACLYDCDYFWENGDLRIGAYGGECNIGDGCGALRLNFECHPTRAWFLGACLMIVIFVQIHTCV